MPRSPPSSQQTQAPPGGLSSSSTTAASTGVPELPVATSEPVTGVSHEEKTKGPGADEVVEDEEEEEEDDEKILEIGHNGRWQKINHQVTRDVPGIDDAYLAMDTEEGVEVHQNIVNFYDFWHDKVNSKDRLVFITEYITSGSLAQFLKKNKRVKGTNSISDKIWRRWCRQILSALSYLHKNEIIHGNLSLASIFIQHNGLVKIGSVSPNAIHQHVKTKNREAAAGLHYAAPELAEGPMRTSADIYAFGICALEMLNLALLGNGETVQQGQLRSDAIQKALDQLNPRTKQFIELCIDHDYEKRPQAHSLIKHLVLQEVFTLKLLSAYALRGVKNLQDIIDSYRKSSDTVLATVNAKRIQKTFTAADTAQIDIEKFFDDISQDLLFEAEQIAENSPQEKDEPRRAGILTESNSTATDRTSTNHELETRRFATCSCDVLSLEDGKNEVCIKLQFGSKMERELRIELQEDDTPQDLVADLVQWGLLSREDAEPLVSKLSTILA
uniref:Protein kinase domain-containing protein n=1 Tax=Amphimedon queenslandica TaxID=400682 RepID=A0A1X7UD98_AMPQE